MDVGAFRMILGQLLNNGKRLLPGGSRGVTPAGGVMDRGGDAVGFRQFLAILRILGIGRDKLFANGQRLPAGVGRGLVFTVANLQFGQAGQAVSLVFLIFRHVAVLADKWFEEFERLMIRLLRFLIAFQFGQIAADAHTHSGEFAAVFADILMLVDQRGQEFCGTAVRLQCVLWVVFAIGKSRNLNVLFGQQEAI